MKWFSKAAVGGLLWLTFSALAFGDTLTITGQPNSVEDGGQFTATLGSNPTQQIYVYCVDDLNFVNVPNPAFAVNVTDLANITEVFDNTRYGQTPTASFSTPTSPTSIGTAQDRYAMAAWLITQYNFASGVTTADDQIQNAIWTLLDATGATYTSNGGVGAYITQAESWIGAEITAGTLTAFENTVVIYSDTNIAGESDPARYTGTRQEMIGFNSSTPEPATVAMLGLGLVAIGMFRKRVKA
jgi:hypothetical protein